ncbi:MAG TPA: hypothetical protein VID75_05255 [Acidimicrobiales bacterium]|jgi:hypothetical protein
MGFFESKSVRTLRQELVAAHVACGMANKLPPEQQARIASTAPREIAAATRIVAESGKRDVARAILTQKLTDPPKSCPAGISWQKIIQAGFDELGDGT